MAVTHIKDLKPDTRNARKHNPRNIGMIEDSLHEVGAARSIVIDEDNRILAGNGTIEAAASAGIERVQVVDADGETIIAVRRTGLTEAQKQRLALFDNRTSDTAEWDAEVLSELAAEGVKLDDLWVQDELDALLEITEEIAEVEEISEYPQGAQLRPGREYIVVMCDNGESGQEEFAKLQELFSLKTVRRGGYKAGSPRGNALGTERVITVARLLEAIGHDSSDAE